MCVNKIFSKDWNEYELIDAGEGKKLERWGEIITIRPEIQAYFQPVKSIKEWRDLAHFEFEELSKNNGQWRLLKENAKSEWNINYHQFTFHLSTTQFKHLGLFPEQRVNWDLILNQLEKNQKMLNLFAYTGVASIIAKSKEAQVTHVDSVKQLISWAHQNMKSSKLADIRWIHEDALKFAKREAARGKKYDLIIMDPPAYGIGAKKERWKLEQKIEELILQASELLMKNGLLILNTYSPRVKLEELNAISSPLFRRVEAGELWKQTTTKKELFYGYLIRAWK